MTSAQILLRTSADIYFWLGTALRDPKCNDATFGLKQWWVHLRKLPVEAAPTVNFAIVGNQPDRGDSTDTVTSGMSLSRDEAREIAIIGVLITIALRVGAGVFQLIEEVTGAWTWPSLAGRFFAPIGSTVGMLTLAAVLIVVLSPNGAVSTSVVTAVSRVAVAVTALGVGSTLYTLVFSFSDALAKLWFAMINGLAAATLAGTGWWILRNFDPDR